MADGLEPKTRHGFFAELKRGRVIRVFVLYAVVGWIVIQVASVVLPALNLPPWATTLVIVLVALGFPIALTLAWAGDIGPGGLRRTAASAAEPAGLPTPDVESVPHPSVVTKPQRTPETRHAIAVLPFVNMSGDPENEYFSDGISEEILNLLAKLPQLKVSSRTSSFVFKGKDVNIPTVARELGVRNVLEGSVRHAGGRVRITAQLIESESDSHLWSETYDREMKDVFAIQDDIANRIVDALQVTLNPRQRLALQNVATANVDAYDFYLKGREHFYAMTVHSYRLAIRMYEQAIELDPEYALAHAGLADAYVFLHRYGSPTPEHAARADEHSRKAVELAPESPEANVARANALLLIDQAAQAERHYETAILLNPNLYEPYYFYGRACMARGSMEKAARLFMQASEANPGDYQAPAFLYQTYEAMGRTDAAQQASAAAMALLERHLKLNPEDPRALCFGASIVAASGERERAIQWAERGLAAAGVDPMVLYNSACTYAMLGDTDRALGLLERAVAFGWGDRAWLMNDSDLASLRDDARYAVLLQQMDG